MARHLTAADMAAARQRMSRVFAAYNEMGKALFEQGSLDAPLQDMVRIRSAHIQHCEQ